MENGLQNMEDSIITLTITEILKTEIMVEVLSYKITRSNIDMTSTSNKIGPAAKAGFQYQISYESEN